MGYNANSLLKTVNRDCVFKHLHLWMKNLPKIIKVFKIIS